MKSSPNPAKVALKWLKKAHYPDRHFPLVSKMSLEEFLKSPPPGFEYSSSGHFMGQRGDTKIYLGPSFFRTPKGSRRLGLLYHELGHDLTLKLRFNDWWLDVMTPFRQGHSLNFENNYGASNHPSEVIADAYSALVVHNGEHWFEDEKNKRLIKRIKQGARILGLPLKP